MAFLVEKIDTTFYSGLVLRISFNVKEKFGGGADNVVANISISDKKDHANNTLVHGVDYTLTEVTLGGKGSFSQPDWTLGSVAALEENTGVFDITLLSNSITYLEADILVTTTTGEEEKDNNVGTYTWEGLPGDALDYLEEKRYEVPVEAFSEPKLPTDAELITWIDANVPESEQRNGTIITYNSDPFTQTIAYLNDSVTISKPIGANPKVTEVYLDGVKFSQNFDLTSSATFDEAAFETFLDASAASLGYATTFTVTETIDGDGDAVITTVGNDGLKSLVIRVQDDTLYNFFDSGSTLLITSVPVGKFKSPDYIWTLNKKGTGYDIVLTNKSENHGLKSYVDVLGNDDTGEVGNPNKPYQTINQALLEMDAYGVVVVHVSNDFKDFYGFDVPNSRYVIFVADSTMTGDGLSLKGYKVGDRRIKITGELITGNSPIILENTGTDSKVLLKDLYLISTTSSPEVSFGTQTTSKDIFIQNVATNVITPDSNINVIGENIFRNAALA